MRHFRTLWQLTDNPLGEILLYGFSCFKFIDSLYKTFVEHYTDLISIATSLMSLLFVSLSVVVIIKNNFLKNDKGTERGK